MLSGAPVKIFSTKNQKLQVKTLFHAEIIAYDYGIDKAEYLSCDSYIPYNHNQWLAKTEDERSDLGCKYYNRDDLRFYYEDLAKLFKKLGCTEMYFKCAAKSLFLSYKGAQCQWQLPRWRYENLHKELLQDGYISAAQKLRNFHFRTFCALPCEV